MERYYIYGQRKVLDEVAGEILKMPRDKFVKLEEQYAVTIVSSEITSNLNQLNENIKYAFEMKKIKLNKFRITEDTLNALEKHSGNSAS